jgi:hypothetical protein
MRLEIEMKRLALALIALALAAPALAQPALKPPLAGLAFLVGDWRSDDGKVADTGGTSRGVSHLTVEADGWSLLRRDRTDITGPDGKPAGGFSQVMLIYPEAGTLRADYADGEGHVIHYARAEIVPGRSVVFTAEVTGGAPAFRLAYELKAPGELAVDFGMLPPGGGPFRPIAGGTLHRAR